MLNLFVYRGSWSVVELYTAQPINLTHRFMDVTEINSPAASYTQTFRVPLTPNNADIFGAFDLTLVASYDYKRRLPARIQRDGITLLEGFVQVKNWTITGGKYTDLELAFFGDTASLSRAVGDAKLSELVTSSLDFTLNYTTIDAGINGGLASGSIRFGLVDRGFNWTAATFPDENGSGYLEHTQVTPFISIKRVLRLIMDAAGLSFESDFFDDVGTKVYLMLLNGEDLQRTYTIGSEAFGIGLGATYTLPSTGTHTLPLLDSGNFYDNGGNYNGSTYVFTPPFDATYTFLFRTIASATHTLRVNASTSGISNVWTGASGNTFFAKNVHLVAGESVTFEVIGNSGDAFYANGVGFGSTSVVLYNFVEDSGIPFMIRKNFPDMKQLDFISGLQKAFNLVFIQDKYNPSHYYIEPFSDYVQGGTAKDWSNKLALDKDYVVKPTTDLQKRTYTFSHTESEDFANELSRNITGDVHGIQKIKDPSSDFAAGKMEIKTPFAPFLPTAIPDSDATLLRLTKDGKALANPRPMLAYYNGLEQRNIKTIDDLGSPAFFKLPLWSESSDWATDVADYSLNFGYPRPLRQIIANPLNGLYYAYWRKFANELYSPDARILEGYFYLTSVELAAFEWSDRIYLFSTYWRVLEIQYDATSEGITKVTLLKILGDIRDCADLPISGKGGIITFNSPSGTTSGSRECCERYGYEYDYDARRCTQRAIVE